MRKMPSILLGLLLLLSACTNGLPTPEEAVPTALPTLPEPTCSCEPTLLQPSAISVPQPTPTPAINIPLVTVDAQEMVLIPAGDFLIGCDQANNAGLNCPADELPQQSATLPDFMIDKFEVTNGQYALCVQSGACTPPSSLNSETRIGYYSDPQYGDFPVIYVSWKQANAYCAWAGKRLPTDAEWEKAARGTTENVFPWGDEPPTCELVNGFPSGTRWPCASDTARVGSYPKGASPYGVMDLSGNVWEWVASVYQPDYLPGAEPSPEAPTTDYGYKVVRGGGWGSPVLDLRISGRAFDPDFHTAKNLGFRCVSEAANP